MSIIDIDSASSGSLEWQQATDAAYLCEKSETRTDEPSEMDVQWHVAVEKDAKVADTVESTKNKAGEFLE